MRLFHGHTSQPWSHGNTLHTCIKENGVTFKQEPDAESYSLRFIDMDELLDVSPMRYWKAGDPSPYAPAPSTGVPGKTETHYSVIYAWGSRNSYDGAHVSGDYNWTQGGAEIIITLK